VASGNIVFSVIRDRDGTGFSPKPRRVRRVGDREEPEGQARVLKSVGTRDGSAKKTEEQMADEGKAEALVGRAEELGLRIEYDSGFLVATRSASADRQRDDEVAEVIEQLSKCRREVFSIAVARARGVRGSNFVGRQVFIPALQVWGTLTDCSAEGIVTVSYPGHRDPERMLTFSGHGDGVLIIVDDERPAPASPTSFAFIADERVRLRCERAEAVGVSLEHDSGFTVAKWRALVGVELAVCEAVVRDLGQSMREIYGYMVGRAQGVRGRDFIGQRVFVEAFDAFGVLASSNVNGGVTVTYSDKHMGSERTCHCRGDDLLVIAEEAAEASAEQGSETTWQRLRRRAFGG
jgi:hypothetical protein